MKKIGKQKPFACGECGKQLTYGEAKAAEFRGCPKCGGSDIIENDAAAVVVIPGWAKAVQGELTHLIKEAA